jgi:hypothetical protein
MSWFEPSGTRGGAVRTDPTQGGQPPRPEIAVPNDSRIGTPDRVQRRRRGRTPDGRHAPRRGAVRGRVGAAGQLVAPPGMLDAFHQLMDDPIPPLRDFAEYLKATYGEDNARAMTRSESDALRAIIEAGGDISRSQAAGIDCPVLLADRRA